MLNFDIYTPQKHDSSELPLTPKGPEGRTVDVKVRDPKNLEKIKVGDQVIITYTEAFAVTLDKPKKQ